MEKIERGGLIAGVAGVALLIVMFLSWFAESSFEADLAREAQQLAEQLGVDAGQAAAVDDTKSAWGGAGWFALLVLLVAVITAIAFAVVTYTGASVSLPIALSTLTLGAGAFAFLVVLYLTINPPADDEREIGLWLGLVATAAIGAGGYIGMQEEDG